MSVEPSLGRRLRVRAAARRPALPARQLPLAADQRDLEGDARERRQRSTPSSPGAQHAELVSAYEDAGVEVHFLEPDPALPYQVFARDSSVMTPGGAVVTQLKQSWRRGEYAPVIRFYQGAGSRSASMITAGALEGGDVTIVEPGCMLIGNGEERTEDRRRAPARRLARGGRLGGADRADPGPVRPHRRARLDPGAEAGRGLRRGRPPAGWSRGCARRASRSSRYRPPTRSRSGSTRSRSATSG